MNVRRIVIIDTPVTKDVVLGKLVELISLDKLAHDANSSEEFDTSKILEAINVREAKGSTFLNESVAIPHARLAGLKGPEVALALTRGGIIDVASERPVEFVFMLLVPEMGPLANLRLLTKAIRVFQNLNARRSLLEANNPTDVVRIIAANEVL